ncbi:hypothetical protein Tsubulata_046755, partial [Turnera subulata]
ILTNKTRRLICARALLLFFFLFSFLVFVSFVQVKEAKELKMAKIAYTSVFFVVLLLSIPSILNAETPADANSIAPSDFLTETTYQVLWREKPPWKLTHGAWIWEMRQRNQNPQKHQHLHPQAGP